MPHGTKPKNSDTSAEANGGIGLEFVKAFIHRGWTVYGTIWPHGEDESSGSDVSMILHVHVERS